MYDIGGIVQFRTEDGALFKNKEIEPFVILSATMKRLLLFLIKRQGQVCLREDILENVWDAYGLSSSNNSLNKYISDLRKIFISNGFNEDFIKTIPRAGFILSCGVSIIAYSELEGEGPVKESTPDKDSFLLNTKLKKKLILCVVFIVCNALFIFLTSKIISKNAYSIEDISLVSEFPLGTIDECKVMLINGRDEQINAMKKKLASDIIKKNKISCSESSVIYMFISEPVLFGHSGRMFFSKCNLDRADAEIHSSCKSFYEVDYDIKK